MAIIEKIRELDVVADYTKQEKIVEGVQNAISESYYAQGDALPSVNELAKSMGCARETVVKAYRVLKEKGIINSKPGVGYFVQNIDTDQEISIAIVLYGFQIFQQQFYNSFRKAVGDKCSLDVFFHHNNEGIYKTILNQIRGKYGFYVVAPIERVPSSEVFKGFQGDKLLIVDRYQYVSDQVAHVSQEFEVSMEFILENLEVKLYDYSKVVLFYDQGLDYPEPIYDAFMSFATSREMKYEVRCEYEAGSIEKGVAYITIGDNDLWELLKDSQSLGYVLGKDIGVLSHNDSPVKEIIAGGISTYSTDFKEMGRIAASYVLDRQAMQKIIPIDLIDRGSI